MPSPLSAAPAGAAFKFPVPLPPKTAQRPDPIVSRVTADGRPAVAVSLGGKLGAGYAFLADPEVWDWLRAEISTHWFLLGPDVHRAYIYGSTRAAIEAARSSDAKRSGNGALSRIILGRDSDMKGRCAVHLNGSRVDLRLCNLRALPADVARKHRPNVPLPVVVAEESPA